ncbi:hydrolase [Nocardioides sp. GY 10113]|uniref:alpha/beta hydrolase family protein n=1 Tax=Nocardioides sp. GY 10113 TaxID=2569761 RepID=UPI0010A77503|nr:alpha/beta family hydrolase [Nocardioides sp. GY 10113]TIC88809.1 hydrolase [Nocardioides sp. GY 10113]
MSQERVVETPQGPARLQIHRARQASATLVMGHGAGRGIDAPDLVALAKALPHNGVSVMLLEQPWVAQGRKVAPPPATLDAVLRSVMDGLRLRTPLILGGRSAGARSAVRCGQALGASGCLAVSFPLHPPGKPERSRLGELAGAGIPTLVVQGERDPMGRPEEYPDPLPPQVDLAVVPGGDHGLVVPKRGPLSQEDAWELLVETTLEWIVRDVVGSGVR